MRAIHAQIFIGDSRSISALLSYASNSASFTGRLRRLHGEARDVLPQNDLTLLDAVLEVASLASPTSPQTVSQRAFDEARSRSLFYPNLSRAKRITERLGLKWPDVLAVAHAHPDEQNHLLGAKGREPNAKWVTPENAASALAVVAKRLNADSLTQGEYRREREKMLAADAKRWMHGGQLRMPSEQQVVSVHGSWDAALSAAALQSTTQREREQRKPKARGRDNDCVAVVARYLKEAGGNHPTATGYEDWRSTQAAAPSLGTITKRHGGWSAVLGEAESRLLEERLGIRRQS
jgi:hypothetical protein